MVALIGILTAREFASAQTLKEFYDAGDNDSFGGGATGWNAQTWTADSQYVLENVQVLVYKAGTPGTCILSLRATSASQPTGSDITSASIDTTSITTSATGEWITVDVTDHEVMSGTMYAWVMRCPSGNESTNRLRWRADNSSPSYAGGAVNLSGDSGSSWTTYTGYDFLFRNYEHVSAGGGTTVTTTVTSTSEFTNTTQDIANGLYLFFIVFFGLLFYFKPKGGD